LTIKEKRKKITDFLTNLYDKLDNTKKNTNKFIGLTEKMTDNQFIAYFTSLINDPKKHLYLEIEAFVNEPNYETVEDAAYNIVGDEYCHLYDYIVYPHLSEDPSKPIYSINKVFNGYINLRRVQQLVNSKNHIPTSVDKRDPRTNQVTQESKAARISDVEQFAMICQGTKNVVKEMFGPRGGDPVMRDEMAYQIATKGSTSLEEMHDSKFNKVSLNTANVYLLGASLETDLLTKNGILPRTIKNQYTDAKSLKRELPKIDHMKKV
jgi:hypothetical protein